MQPLLLKHRITQKKGKTMKKQKTKLLIIFITFITFFIIRSPCFASKEEILKSQSESLNISGFLSEANKYTKEAFSDLDVNELMNNAIKGNVDNKTILGKILSLFGSEIGKTLKIIRKYCQRNCNT